MAGRVGSPLRKGENIDSFFAEFASGIALISAIPHREKSPAFWKRGDFVAERYMSSQLSLRLCRSKYFV